MKQTEKEELPNGWEIVSIGEIFDFKNGLNKEKEFFGQGTPIVNYKDVYRETALNVSNVQGKVTVDDNELERYSVEKGDVFFTRTSESVDEIAFSAVVMEDIPNAVFSGFVLRARDVNQKLDNNFKRYCFSGFDARKEIIRKSTYTTRALTNGTVLSEVKLLIPPIEEQILIGEILSQWDEAIETTQNLIQKLKLRKKGLMQGLLSGKKRLSGFSEGWEIIRGDKLFASISNKKHNGEFEVLSATQKKGVIPRSETGIDIKYDKKSLGNYKKIDIGDFVISLRSFQGGIEYSNYEGLVSPAYTVLRENLPIAKKFYQEYLKTENFINRLNSIIYGIRDGKQISYKEFGSLKFEYPPLEEQKAIGEIIKIADEEIDEKKEYLIKIKEQKKGLMQQLLTGKKRVKID